MIAGRARLAALALLLSCGCTRLVAGYGEDGPWLVRETPRFTLHYRAGSQAEAELDAVAAQLESGLDDLCNRLGVRFEQVISYYLYRPDEAAHIGVQSGGFAYPDLLTIRQTFGGGRLGLHEVVHVVANRTLGLDGTELASEGLAVALAGRYGGLSISEWRTTFFASGYLGPDDLLFRPDRFPESQLYPQSGSFVLYLLDRFGPEPVKVMYSVPPERFRGAFVAAFGAELDAVFAEYVAARGVAP